MRLRISKITDVEDLKYLAPIEFAAFVEDAGHNLMLGRNSPSSINATIDRQKKEFNNDPAGCWIKVVDADVHDRIVGASNWLIYPTYVPRLFDEKGELINALPAETLGFMQDEKRQEDGIIAMKDFINARYRNAREPHIVLNLLFVDPEYHRKGAGRLMVEWGNRLADALMLPVWVEASKQGQGLYESCGYEVVERIQLGTKFNTWPGDRSYPLMCRPVKVSVQ